MTLYSDFNRIKKWLDYKQAQLDCANEIGFLEGHQPSQESIISASLALDHARDLDGVSKLSRAVMTSDGNGGYYPRGIFS